MMHLDIHKRLNTYDGQQVLHIEREFLPGSITKISGPSGAGKTTLLKLIAGLTSAEKGRIVFNEQIWFDADKKINQPPQKRRIGFVFQDYALFPNMTVYEHMAYASSDKAWIEKLLKTGRLDTLSHHKPTYLSGGQQQRLAILRALAIKPQLLLMDEPFSALDRVTKSDLIAGLKEIFAELNSTVLIVSHNIQEMDVFPGEEFCIGD